LDPKRLDGYSQKDAERRYKVLNCAKDSKKGDDRLSYQSGGPDLLGRNIGSMGLKNMSPDIKKGAKTQEDKSSKTDPTRYVVERDPADVMIPGNDVTFCLGFTTLFHSHGADI
jgi:hypothetical protein